MKHIPNETITHFKRLMNRIYKKEEESLLNKKKKREEIKQKNKTEKNKLNNINNPNQYNFYQNMYMSPMQINNQNPAYYNEYQNYYYLNPSQPYQMNRQMFPPFMPNSFIMPPRNLEESLNMIYSRNIVNHIIGAFYIKECQERQKNSEKRKVPVAKVELNDNNEDINNKETEEKNNSEKKENENDLDKKEINDKEEKKEEEKGENNEDKNEHNNNNDNELKRPSLV